MTRVRAYWLAAILGVAGLAVTVLGAADEKKEGPAPGVPELKVLDKFVGEWDEGAELAGGEKIKAAGTTKWVLGGTHVQSAFSIPLPDGAKLEHLVLMTWDQKKKIYRSWMFSSYGADAMESTGVWDEAEQTFTTTSKPNAEGVTTVGVSRFVTEDEVEWSAVSKDKSGKEVFSVKGKDTRKK